MRLLLPFTVITLFGVITAEIWEDGDTVVIDSPTPRESGRFKREDQVVIQESRSEDEDTVLIRSQRCVTPSGKFGQCMSLKECYPILFPFDPTAEMAPGTTFNDALADQLIASSGFCGGGTYQSDSSLFYQVANSEVSICCTPQVRTPAPLPPSQNEPNTTLQDIPVRSTCGTVKVQLAENKIVGGREAQRGEFPWIVALMNSGREFCGGSLVDTQTVVTAAHCVQHMKPADVQKLTIQIGDHDIYSTSDGKHEVRTASRILYHKDFSMQHLHHDVALIRLSQPITATEYIQIVCMHPGSPSYDNVQADVAGWGQIRDGGPQPSKLRTASVAILSHQDCVQKYGNHPPAGIGKGMVCAGGKGMDSCRGDSGGPLTINSRSRAQLVGIVSWGIGCGSYPGVYTRVDQYLPWINKNRMRSFAEY